MTTTYDVIVLGLGAMGSASAYHLARRGMRVLGIEQFEIGHDRGSSHGRSRVIRKAYFEDPRYVPLLHAAYDRWRDLEAASGTKLIHVTGCLNMGQAGHPAMRGLHATVEMHDLPHERLDAEGIHRRWPAILPNAGDVGVFEKEGGYLVPERCIQLLMARAAMAGAVLETQERVLRWTAEAEDVRVETDRDKYHCKQLVIAAGAWLPQIAADLGVALKIERQVQCWFQPKKPELFGPDRLPVFIHFLEDRSYYGIPGEMPTGFKAARHHGGAITSADSVDRHIHAADEAELRGYLAKHLPEADGPLIDAKVCLYTNTPDEHFIIDRHPRHENVLIVGGFSGHGFKFAALVGDIVADLLHIGRTPHPIELFSIQRFASPQRKAK